MRLAVLVLSLLLCSPAWATVNVVRFPSGTPVQVCQPSDTNTNCGGGGSSGLTIGTTTITSGTNSYLLYDNNGNLGEKAGGSGTVTSITFSSPLTGGTITGSGTVGITANTFDAYGAASAITLAGLGGTTLAAAEAAITPTELGLVIGTNVLAQRTFGTAANNNTGDFLASGGTAANSSELNGQVASYYAPLASPMFTGNVGIGSTTANFKLQVAGTADVQGFSLNQNPRSGYVLVGTNVGVGTWMAASTLPISGGSWVNTATSALNMSGYGISNINNVGVGTITASAGLTVVGNVGIGTTNPGSKIDVNGTATFGASDQGRLTIGNGAYNGNVQLTSSGANGYLYFNSTGGFTVFQSPTNIIPNFQLEAAGTSAYTGIFRSYSDDNSVANRPLLFYTSGQSAAGDIMFYSGVNDVGATPNLTSRMGNYNIIFSPSGTGSTQFVTGNVGIGTTNPGVALDLGTTGNLKIIAQKSTSGVRYLCIDTNGNIASQAAACVGT